MTKVYPNGVVTKSSNNDFPSASASASAFDRNGAVLTVWKKSLLFNCNGFTVFDGKGDLIFRVDNYMEFSKGEIVLMDAAGRPLLTIRRKRLSLGESWMVYDGETAVNPRYYVRKAVKILKNKCLAYVSCDGKKVMYEIEGSYTQRCCAVYDEKKQKVAEIKRKETVGGVTLGGDVFRLIVQPGFDSAFSMALVILLDQMFPFSSNI